MTALLLPHSTPPRRSGQSGEKGTGVQGSETTEIDETRRDVPRRRPLGRLWPEVVRDVALDGVHVTPPAHDTEEDVRGVGLEGVAPRGVSTGPVRRPVGIGRAGSTGG